MQNTRGTAQLQETEIFAEYCEKAITVRISLLPLFLKASIVIAQLGNKESVFRGAIDNAVLIVDAPGPVAGKPVFERFRLAAPITRTSIRLSALPSASLPQHR
jgi:hypothetical protein